MTQTAARPSPFKGLAPFGVSDEDALFFFGRTRETEVIAANLQASRLTVLYGPSGVGKSSILRAGVAHRLRDEPGVLVAIVDLWSGDPVATLLHALGEEDGTIADALDEAAARAGGDVYLILDQFEEYFLYHQEEDVLSAELAEVVERRGLSANILIGIREDSLGRLDTFRKPISNLLANRLRLDRLDRTAAREAIEGPIARYNELVDPDQRVEVEPALVQAVLDQVASGRVDPGAASGRGVVEGDPSDSVEAPYLQLVLTRLWEVEAERGSRRLRLETLNELGGAERVVERHLERAMDELSAGEKDAAAAMYHFLVTPSGTKIAHDVADLAGYAGVEEDEAGAVLRRLTTERIVRSSSANGDARYEIFHDVLADAVLGWRNRYEADRALEQERTDARRKHRRAVIVAAAALVALALMAVVAIFAWTQRSHAKREARTALARELTASSFLNLDTDPELSLLLAREAAKRERSPAVESVLRTALIDSRLRRQAGVSASTVLANASTPTDVEVNGAGTRVVITGADGKARVFDPTTGAALYTLVGGRIVDAAMGPFGGVVATASRDGTIRLWNLHTGRPVSTLQSGTSLTSVALSGDSRLVAGGGADGAVHVWNLQRHKQVRFPVGGRVSAVSFSPNSRLLLAVSGNEAQLLDIASGKVRGRFRHGGKITSAIFSPTSRLVATTSLDHSARLWHADTGRPFRRFSERGAVFAAAFSPRGKLLATADSDGAARVYEVSTGTKTDLVGHRNYVTDVDFSSDGKRVATASRDGTARVWEAETGRQIALLAGHRGPVLIAKFSRNGSSVITAGVDGTARVWDPTTEPHLRLVGRQRSPVVAIELTPDGRKVVGLTENGAVRIWRLAPRKLLVTLTTPSEIRAMSLSRDGRLVVGAGSDGVARVWRVSDGRLVRALADGGRLTTARFSPDGRLVVAASRRGLATIWRIRDGRRLHVLRGRVPLNDARFSPDGRFVVTAGRRGTVRLWAAGSGVPVKTFPRLPGSVRKAEFSPDGKLIVTAGTDPAARVWDARGRLVATLRKHQAALTDARFDSDGSLLVTTSLDHDGALWDVREHRLLHALSGHAGLVTTASFSPDSRWIVTAGPSSAALWETSTGNQIFLLRGHTSLLTGAAFARDGRRIVTASLDGTIRSYICDVCGGLDDLLALADRRLARTSRTLTRDERAQYLGGS
jgi:WD40 repeat protein